MVNATVALGGSYRQSVLQLSQLVVPTVSGPPHSVYTVQCTAVIILYCTHVHMKQYHIWLHKGLAKWLQSAVGGYYSDVNSEANSSDYKWITCYPRKKNYVL